MVPPSKQLRFPTVLSEWWCFQWLGVAFSITNGLVDNISDTATTDKRTGWIGKVYYEEDGPDQAYWIGYYIDSFLLITLGGIPWQVC